MKFFEHECCVINNDLEHAERFESVIKLFTTIIENTFNDINNQRIVQALTASLNDVKFQIEENEEDLKKKMEELGLGE